MTIVQAHIDALGPLLFRDARPFTSDADETRARSLESPLPSTVAGLCRTVIGDALGWAWQDGVAVDNARLIHLKAHWLVRSQGGRRTAVTVCPSTALPYRDEGDGSPDVLRLEPEPLKPDEGCDLPHQELRPMVPRGEVKPWPGFRWWSWADLEAWLRGETRLPTEMDGPVADERVQIELDPESDTVKEGRLFTTEYRSWEDIDRSAERGGQLVRWSLEARLDVPSDWSVDALSGPHVAHFGGERRPVAVTLSVEPTRGADRDDVAPGLSLTQALSGSLEGQRHVAAYLVTPGLFDGGWRPGWLGEGTPPHPALRGARLVGAAVPRREPVSGWDFAQGRRGPKATRWLVPAGAVFFLELDHGLTPADLRELWLTSLCDRPTDRDDGFGLAVWGLGNGEGN